MNTQKAFDPENFDRELIHVNDPGNPFSPLSKEQIYADLAISREEAANGKGMDMEEALTEMGRQHGFI